MSRTIPSSVPKEGYAGGASVGAVDRRDVASWLAGPRAVRPDTAPVDYPGQRLGRPENGPGSVVGVGHRLLAFAVDALLCDGVAWLLFRNLAWVTPVFAVEVVVFTWLLGQSAGQRVCGLRVERLDGSRVSLARALLRTALILLLVPALIWDRDGRGLHDKAADSVVVRAERNSAGGNAS